MADLGFDTQRSAATEVTIATTGSDTLVEIAHANDNLVARRRRAQDPH